MKRVLDFFRKSMMSSILGLPIFAGYARIRIETLDACRQTFHQID